ncbi:MAG: J domain-containing protein [Magnetospirillum sp.]|nr:J domain-containing protein [Magnetospirillum sp.]
MSTNPQDPRGYYAVLGIPTDASMAAVKAAYRARVKAVHPDRNGSPDANSAFRQIVEAYAVLRDAVRRAEYDATGAAAGDDTPPPAAPFACCRCGHVTAQPRYLVLHQVKSYLLWAKTSRVEGIFCRDCADRAATQASTATWAWGWWSLPGLVLAPLALIRNLLGGSKPRHVNARILIRQARAFLTRGDLGLAHAVARQAHRYARVSSHRRQVADILRATAGAKRKLKDRWKPWSGKSFVPQLLPLAALPLTAAVFTMIVIRPWNPDLGASAGIEVSPPAVGEIRHVAVDALKVRQAPTDRAPVLTLLDRFTAVTTVATTPDSPWVQVRVPSGIIGFVPVASLYGGSEELLRHEWCGEHRGTPPQAGEALVRRGSGEHQLLVHNDGRNDAIIKLKTLSGNTVVAYYIPATYHIIVSGIPEGTYRIEFATGANFSRACGLFVDGMKTSELPFTLTLRHVPTIRISTRPALPEISLAPPQDGTSSPRPIPAERFIADD